MYKPTENSHILQIRTNNSKNETPLYPENWNDAERQDEEKVISQSC
jgi:hypothetical protein